MENEMKYFVYLAFEDVSLPPFQDILILGRKCPHGKDGVSKCLNFLAPDDFELIELDDPNIEALLVNKRILKRLPIPKIIEVLQQKVFPYITKGEIIRVDFKVKVTYEKIEVK